MNCMCELKLSLTELLHVSMSTFIVLLASISVDTLSWVITGSDLLQQTFTGLPWCKVHIAK